MLRGTNVIKGSPSMAGLRKGETAKGRKPRIYISIEPQTDKLINEIVSTTGQSRSAFVAEMVESAVPSMLKIRATLKRLSELEEDQKKAVLGNIDSTEDQLLKALEDFEQLGLLKDDSAGSLD